MENLIAEKPDLKLHGRLAHTVSFVEKADIKNKTILDIGCGFGWFELSALHRGAKKIVATEPTAKDLATIKKNIRNPRIRIQEANATNLPFADSAFDTVVCWEVIEHIPKNTESTMFSEVKRVLKPHGSLYLSTPCASWAARIFDPAWWLIGHRHYSLKQLTDFGTKAGFKLRKADIKGKWWEITGIVNMYFSKWILRKRRVFENLFVGKIDKEYMEKSGFVDIFVKFQKI